MIDDSEFKGKVAVVTGAGQGMGKAVSQRLSSGGAKLVINDVSAESAERTVASLVNTGGEAVAAPGDVTSKADVDRMVQTALDRYGGVHILVNNAGVLRPTLVIDIEEYLCPSQAKSHTFRLHLNHHRKAPLTAKQYRHSPRSIRLTLHGPKPLSRVSIHKHNLSSPDPTAAHVHHTAMNFRDPTEGVCRTRQKKPDQTRLTKHAAHQTATHHRLPPGMGSPVAQPHPVGTSPMRRAP